MAAREFLVQRVEAEDGGQQNVSKELIFSLTKKDFTVEFFKASGKGGQNRNKRDTAVRITHPASGAIGYSADEREQHRNKRKALERLVASEKFVAWNRIRANEVLGKRKTDEQIKQEVDEMIDRDMANGLIKIECVTEES
jgi:peptide chain release factor 1